LASAKNYDAMMSVLSRIKDTKNLRCDAFASQRNVAKQELFWRARC
jgi:hypothetical protein